MRCFIAFPIPAEIRERIWEAADLLRKRYAEADAKVSWVKPENMHITLAFLGEVDEERLSRIEEKLDEPELAVPEFRAALGGLGQFPPKGKPRILTVRLGEGERECAEVESRLRALLRDEWQPDRNAFSAHVTLGRVKYLRQVPRFERGETELSDSFTLSKIVLFESRLSREGAAYLPLKTIELEKQ